MKIFNISLNNKEEFYDKSENIFDAKLIKGKIILFDKLLSFTYSVNDLPKIWKSILTIINDPFTDYIELQAFSLLII